MKLYFSPGACSLACHIALCEAGIKFETVKVNLADKKTEKGDDFTKINAKGYVPVLDLGNGQCLTEGAVILQYIADQKPESKLAPAAGTMERYRLQEWLNYVAAEMHKGVGALFNKAMPDDMRKATMANIDKRMGFLSTALEGKAYLMGDTFTVADGYLFTTLNWLGFFQMDVAKWPTMKAYYDRVAARPAVKQAMAAEGILKG
jgi:glutathione S-transferase